MACNPKKTGEHMFSIELKSKECVKSLALPNENEGNVLIEGFLGKLKNLSFTEGIMLEIEGTNGNLRIDFTEKELKELLLKGTPIPKKDGKGDEGLANSKDTGAEAVDCNQPQFRHSCLIADKRGGEET